MRVHGDLLLNAPSTIEEECAGELKRRDRKKDGRSTSTPGVFIT